MANDNYGIGALWIFTGLLLILFAINSYYIYNLNDQVSQLKEAIKDLPKTEGLFVQDEVQKSSFTLAEKDMPIVAVSNDEEGMVNEMALKLIPGNNDILIKSVSRA